MKFISVGTKLNIAIIAVSFVSLIVGSTVLFWYSKQTTTEVYQQVKDELINSAEDKIKAKQEVGITNAISIANDERIKNALKFNKREGAINSLQEISTKMKDETDFKNVRIHLHTKDNISFLRNWKVEKYGDDLSSFRDAVVAVNKTKKPIVSFEAGREGLLLRAISPVIDEKEEHFGSLEFIQGLNSVAKEFDKNNIGFLLLMDDEINKSISTGSGFLFKESKKLDNYVISQKFVNKNFLDDAKNIDILELFSKGYILSSKYFYTYKDVSDFQNKKLGIVLLGKPLIVVNKAIDGAKTLIYIALLGILLMAIIISIVVLVAIRKLVSKPLSMFENGLLDFFLFLQGKKDYTESFEINTNDEFGVMATSLKENISVSARLHEEINDLNANLEQKIEEKTKKVTTLLDNAGQGFLTFDEKFLVDEEYSLECIKLLGEDIQAKDISTLIFEDSSKQEFFKSTLLFAMVQENSIKRDSILSLLPNEVILNNRALKLEYKILDDKIMLVITNITAQKRLEKKIKKEQEILKMVVEIVSESDVFYDTKKAYEDFIDNCDKQVNMKKTPLHNISEIYRTIHTFKGSFAQLFMQDIVRFLHAVESEISKMIKENTHSNDELVELLKKSDFKNNFQDELNIIRGVLGDEFLDSQNYLKIDYSEIKTLQKKICTVFQEQNLKTPESKEIISHVISLSNQKLLNLLRPYTHLVQQLSKRLEKEVYEFEIIGDKEIVVSDNLKPFIKSLIHVFRNSIDHGIEDADTRVENDKDDVGTISCSFEQKDKDIEIVISDDGAGIDKDKVLAKAIKEGIVTKEEAQNLSDKEIYAFIFSDNFSLKDEISDLSGRGVGMSAVKFEIDKIDGRIDINTQKNVGTTFVFTIPFISE